jgi:DNA-binding LacI/PurR family transcriptional regulator
MVKSSVKLLMKELEQGKKAEQKIYQATLIERDSVATREE